MIRAPVDDAVSAEEAGAALSLRIVESAASARGLMTHLIVNLLDEPNA